MWQRWNQTTHIFEKSDNDGVLWVPLPLSADIITEGVLAKARQHAQTAYKDEANVFTLTNKFDGLDLDDNKKIRLGTGNDAELYYDGTDLILNSALVGTGALSLLGGQIKFPATQIASSDVNTLDDYERGNWTPAFTGTGSITSYSSQYGAYIKIGRIVVFTGRLVVTNKGTIGGVINISGLPFTVASSGWSPFLVGRFVNMATNWALISGYANAGTTNLVPQGITTASTGMGNVSGTDLSNTTDWLFGGAYITT